MFDTIKAKAKAVAASMPGKLAIAACAIVGAVVLGKKIKKAVAG